MKKLFLVCLLIITLYSCSKNNSENNELLGNWNVVNDSSVNTNQFYTLTAGDNGIIGSNYNGDCNATFNFNSNGNLETSFFNCLYSPPSLDSAKYVVTNNQLTISIYAQSSGCCSFIYLNPLITRTYNISNLTAHAATLTFEMVHPSAEGVSGVETEVINLKR